MFAALAMGFKTVVGAVLAADANCLSLGTVECLLSALVCSFRPDTFKVHHEGSGSHFYSLVVNQVVVSAASAKSASLTASRDQFP